jgi:osmoprotectant transport system permease protein
MDVFGDAWSFLADPDNWTGPRGILVRLQAHVWVSIVALFFSALLAIPCALWLAHRRIAPVASVAIVNIGRAIPSFAIIALVLPFSIEYGFGLGFWPTCVALVALGIPPMFTNTYTGVAGAPAETMEAARGIGMTSGELLRKVELPLASPLIVTGIRISAVQIVATATLGALVGYECLGTFIVQGLAQSSRGYDRVVVGAMLVAGLSLTIDAVLGLAQPRLAPWAKRLR